MRLREPSGRRTDAQRAGGDAEERAALFLACHGLAIVARNYRTRFGEIDLVARDGDTLVFVEVRSRTRGDYGDAAESITPAKQRRIESAARSYLSMLRREPPCRFDVVTLDDGDATWLRAAFDAAAG